ncbi:HWE histidine kinase domain-containing protein [Sphingomonas lenta]|uniref:histidine kinase n=1 Tax=Sphingomonas lenta TaxID=1141887 RepID=A0A2A2SHM5_9SPHN|nr:HWE histidine kinase domain-containing protein [Sphingomonas lenta]PAX08670.1 hypothetical protein CKY28_04665 [Sphingomonas lenta]
MTPAVQGDRSEAERERDAALARLRHVIEEREADAREAQRHLRNVLSVTRSLARRTADEAGSLDDFRVLFDGRLAAFARVQSAVARDGRTGFDLGRLIGDECLGFGIGVGADGVELLGEPVRLLPRAAGLLALVAHELVAELAAAGGAGRGRVSWTEDAGLEIDWRQGVGAGGFRPLPDWIRQAIGYELKGEVAEERADDVVRRRIGLPRSCLV